jgi:molecular chaperone GrpE (heat shock protein)
MGNWLERLLGGARAQDAEEPKERVLALEREVQRLRLDLAAAEERAERLRRSLERQQGDAGARVEARMEQLLSSVAAPVAQLLTQAYLVEREGRSVPTRDVLTVARRLVRALEDAGLTVEGQVGQRESFDPDRHAPLSANANLSRGQPVVVRFAGVTYGGRWLRKAGVEPAFDTQAE